MNIFNQAFNDIKIHMALSNFPFVKNTTFEKYEVTSDYTKTVCIKCNSEGWSDGSVVKSTTCSSRGLRFGSWHPHGSQPLAALFQGIQSLFLIFVGMGHISRA